MRLAPMLLCAVVGAPGAAQDVRELSTPTPHSTHVGINAAAVNNVAAAGNRLVDIEYRGGAGQNAQFDAVFVQNAGPYQTTWWWYYGQTAAQLNALLTNNQARLIDLEPYDDGAGNTLFAAIMVDNTGQNARTWWWYYGATTAQLNTAASNNNARIVDLEEYTIGGVPWFSAVMIRNAGADQRQWWWYFNITGAQLNQQTAANQARVYDLQPRSNGNYNAVMIRDQAPVAWYWFFGTASADIVPIINNFGVRIIDLETYVLAGTRYWAFATINNSNAETTTVGNLMRNTTNGTVGAWLQQLGAGGIVHLNPDAVFEPASTMKTLHHVHAMRRVTVGAVTLATVLNVFTAINGSCPLDQNPVNENLQRVLELMMRNSDNNRTQAVTAHFGQAAINATAGALGMASTNLRHRIGCAADAVLNPNQITLRDLHRLHDQVKNGYLGANRDTFYDIMLHSTNDLGIAAMINQEANALGGISATTAATFLALTRVAHKGGNYALSNGGPPFYHRAEFGWLSLPFISNCTVSPQEYSFGAFVNFAGNDANAGNAIYTQAIPGMLRPIIRQALQTWLNVRADVTSIGNNCGGYLQTVTGLPYLNSTPTYRAAGGFPGTLAVMGIGFSNQRWQGINLPASLVPFGSAQGCFAYHDVVATRVAIADGNGAASIPFGIPNNQALLCMLFYTQFYSFGSENFRTTNAVRSLIGY